MPIDNGETAARLQNGSNTACEPWLIRYSVKCVGDQDVINGSADQLGNRVSIAFEQLAICRSHCRDLSLRNRQHPFIDVDPYYVLAEGQVVL